MMNNEKGRSMVEMLGVLAIIGVLSVAGIAGYSMAMKKYRVNEVLNAASQCAVLAQAQYETSRAEATVTGQCIEALFFKYSTLHSSFFNSAFNATISSLLAGS